jgi:hypothetical protein
MWRALFLAVGIFICVVGVECLFIETAVFTQKGQAAASEPFATEAPKKGKKITPPDWAPWGLLGAGMVVIIYSFTIPRRVKG